MSNFYNTTDSALAELKRLRPDISASGLARNRGRIKAHLEHDYSEGRGLRVLGIDARGTKNFIEFYHNELNGRIEIEHLVAVLCGDSWEVFDRDEALGYNSFIIRPEALEAAKAEQRENHLERRRKEIDE